MNARALPFPARRLVKHFAAERACHFRLCRFRWRLANPLAWSPPSARRSGVAQFSDHVASEPASLSLAGFERYGTPCQHEDVEPCTRQVLLPADGCSPQHLSSSLENLSREVPDLK